MKLDNGWKTELDSFNLTVEEIISRKKWLNIETEDEQNIHSLSSIMQVSIKEIMAEVYEHFTQFNETEKYFPNHETLNRAKNAQTEYFERLFLSEYDENYVENRLKVGLTHHRIGLDPKWYLGAYCMVLNLFRAKIQNYSDLSAKEQFEKISALIKMIFFDMGLAIESYVLANQKEVQAQRDTIQELFTERRAVKSIFERAPNCIVKLDQNFICLECNKPFLDSLSLNSREEAIGKSIFELVPTLSNDILAKVFKTGEPYIASALPIQLDKSKTGKTRFWDWSTWPLDSEDKAIQGLLATFTDVSDKVLLQQQREDFVATLTHDLKTPILAANRAIKLLIEGDFGKLTSEQEQVLETIYQSNDNMYNMVQTLLDVYRYDSGAKKLNFIAQDLSEIVNKLVLELAPLVATKEITLELNLPESSILVYCDAAEIRRVMQNLIDNSLKFTPKGGHITITFEQTSELSIISIKDTGKGISEEDKPKLFQRFWQASTSGRYYAGTGLGLYLCRKIIESHGGKIICQSQLGQGSKFEFSILNKHKL